MMGGSGKDMRLVAEQTSYLAGNGAGATDDEAKFVWNRDLDGCKADALFIGRGETEDGIGFVDSVSSENGPIGIVLDKTSFYAEAGGQTYDTGVIRTDAGAEITVTNVQAYGQFVLHLGEVTRGSVSTDDVLTCSVDYVRRSPIASNHTVTHLLNHSLKDVLVTRPAEAGESTKQEVDQKGSLNDEFKLRFDFSWNGPLTPRQLRDVENSVNARIDDAVPVRSYVAPLEEARNISSLRAVFGEVYPDPVRVVSVGPETVPVILSNPTDAAWLEYSVEFCGGTHLTNTGEAGRFVLLKEEGIAKGVRRITGVTMEDARAAEGRADDFLVRLGTASKLGGGEELGASIGALSEDLKDLSISAVRKEGFRNDLTVLTKRFMTWKKERAAERTAEVTESVVAAAASVHPGGRAVLRCDFGIDGKVAKSVATAYGKRVKDKAFLLVSADVEADRFMVVAFAPKGMKGEHAVDCKAWAAAATAGTGAKGGGKKDMAQFNAGGADQIGGVLERAGNF